MREEKKRLNKIKFKDSKIHRRRSRGRRKRRRRICRRSGANLNPFSFFIR